MKVDKLITLLILHFFSLERALLLVLSNIIGDTEFALGFVNNPKHVRSWLKFRRRSTSHRVLSQLSEVKELKLLYLSHIPDQPHKNLIQSKKSVDNVRSKIFALDVSCFGRRNLVAAAFSYCGLVVPTLIAAPLSSSASDANDAVITDKIYIDVKGLPSKSEAEPSTTTKRIIIGLYGKAAPDSVEKIKQLVNKGGGGLPALCRPKAERMLQKEQLEANKVYNNCIEKQDIGVTLAFSTIWRIIKNYRIDIGAVVGKFVAREYPEWIEAKPSSLRHDKPGVVSVRRGNTSGFGFTVYPGGGTNEVARILDDEHIIVGQVIEGLDIVQQLNETPVIASSKVNYMGLTGGPKSTNAPDRSCRYGGPMYCNENKPLIKLTIADTGIL